MKTNTSLLCCAALFLGAALFNQCVQAQLTLSGTNYTQNFDAISNGLPAGWSLRTNATTTTLGTITTNFNAGGKTWGDSGGEFGNCASTVANSGTNFTGSESTAIQAGCTNRALAVRQTGSFGDPGAAFVLQITNTLGLSNLTFSVHLCTLRTNGYTTIWTNQYAVGNSPSSFTTLGAYTNSSAFGTTTQTYNLGADANSTSSNVWIRIVALSPATGSGSRATFGIDDFSLSWAGNGASGARPFISGFAITNGHAQIDFTGNTNDAAGAFILQTAGQVSGPYADAGAGVIMTQVNPGNFHAAGPLNGAQQFYRIKRP